MIILASWEGNTWAGQGGLSSVDRDGENKLAISKRSNRRILVREKSREMRKELVHSLRKVPPLLVCFGGSSGD